MLSDTVASCTLRNLNICNVLHLDKYNAWLERDFSQPTPFSNNILCMKQCFMVTFSNFFLQCNFFISLAVNTTRFDSHEKYFVIHTDYWCLLELASLSCLVFHG